VILSHRVNFLRTHPGGLLEPRGTTVCMYPLFHMGAWTLALQAWQARSQVTFLESPTAENVAGAVERERAERLNCIPAVWQRILDEGASRWDLSSLRLVDSGTSATPPELLAAIAAAVPGAKLRVFYGSTESGGATLLEHDDISRKPGSCGLPHPGVEIRLTDIGEICVRSPVLFDGYFDAPEATNAALVDGWYQTGDLGTLDDEGFLSIIGRAKDTIRTGGETVSPSEVEGILASFPGLADIAIVGIPDPRWGEVVCAVAVPAEGSEPPTLDALQAHCEGRLARFKVPRRLELVESVPRTPATNQVRRRELIKRFSSVSTG
jgi:acyl-CoA synthetase (AMP-forming)/AMP-acid ligase II